MTNRTARFMRGWLRDMCLGAAIFLALPLVGGLFDQRGHLPSFQAHASDALGLLAVDASVALGPMLGFTPIDVALLGFSFSLLVALNLAFVRHLRRVSASARRDARRGKH